MNLIYRGQIYFMFAVIWNRKLLLTLYSVKNYKYTNSSKHSIQKNCQDSILYNKIFNITNTLIINGQIPRASILHVCIRSASIINSYLSSANALVHNTNTHISCTLIQQKCIPGHCACQRHKNLATSQCLNKSFQLKQV